MSSISAVGNSSDAWAGMRSQMQARMFAKADSNSDGGVDKSELSSMLGDIDKMTGQSLSSKVDDTFKSMDGNSDGKLSSDELGKGMESLLPTPSTVGFAQSRAGAPLESQAGSLIDKLFSEMDSNGDGSLNKDELTTMAQQIKSDTGLDVTAKLEKLAQDNDGAVSKDQFQAAMEAERPAGPPGGAARGGQAAGGQAASGDDGKSYDPLDTNKDGTVSMFERLIGDLKSTSTNQADATDGNALAQLAKKMYEGFSNSFAQGAQSSQLSLVA